MFDGIIYTSGHETDYIQKMYNILRIYLHFKEMKCFKYTIYHHRHHITAILLKVALNTIKQTQIYLPSPQRDLDNKFSVYCYDIKVYFNLLINIINVLTRCLMFTTCNLMYIMGRYKLLCLYLGNGRLYEVFQDNYRK